MPKIKTHKGTAKRIKITSTGKLTRRRAFGNHMLAKKAKVVNVPSIQRLALVGRQQKTSRKP